MQLSVVQSFRSFHVNLVARSVCALWLRDSQTIQNEWQKKKKKNGNYASKAVIRCGNHFCAYCIWHHRCVCVFIFIYLLIEWGKSKMYGIAFLFINKTKYDRTQPVSVSWKISKQLKWFGTAEFFRSPKTVFPHRDDSESFFVYCCCSFALLDDNNKNNNINTEQRMTPMIWQFLVNFINGWTT